MSVLLREKPVAKAKASKGKPVKYIPAKIGEEAVHLAKIAASFKGMTLADYVTPVVRDVARRDIDAEHAKMKRSEGEPK
jgi:hypothetical protein